MSSQPTVHRVLPGTLQQYRAEQLISGTHRTFSDQRQHTGNRRKLTVSTPRSDPEIALAYLLESLYRVA